MVHPLRKAVGRAKAARGVPGGAAGRLRRATSKRKPVPSTPFEPPGTPTKKVGFGRGKASTRRPITMPKGGTYRRPKRGR
jgi:hypothetical protein